MERLQHALGIAASDRAIHRFLLKEGLVDSVRYRRPRYQDTVHKGLHNVTQPGTIQMDVKYVTPHLSGPPHTTYLYAGIDLFTRYRAAWIYEPLDSSTAAEALEWIFFCMPFPVSFVQTDNGLEFQAQFQRLIDATTGLGAAYNFPGRMIRQLPKMVDITLYGYHDTVQWQDIKTLTVS